MSDNLSPVSKGSVRSESPNNEDRPPKKTRIESRTSTPRDSSPDAEHGEESLSERDTGQTRSAQGLASRPRERHSAANLSNGDSDDEQRPEYHSAEDRRSDTRSGTPVSRSSSRASRYDGAAEAYNSTPRTPKKRAVDYRLAMNMKSHRGPITQVRFSPDGQWIASASADATIKIWDCQTGELEKTLSGHIAGVSALAWSPDSTMIASGADDKLIWIWDRISGKAQVPLKGHHNYIYSLGFSPNGNILASGSYDEAVFLWDIRAGRLMRSLPAHSDPVSGIDFVRDGTMVASCSHDGLIRLWDTATGQCLQTIIHDTNSPVTSVRFSPNGKYLMAWTIDSSLRLWDYVEGQRKKTFQGHQNIKFSICGAFGVSDENMFIASGSEDGRVFLWDVNTKAVLQDFHAHTGQTMCIDTHPFLEMMVSGGNDRHVKLWTNESSADEQASQRDLEAAVTLIALSEKSDDDEVEVKKEALSPKQCLNGHANGMDVDLDVREDL